MGFAYKYGDNVDTDVIIPARYLNTSEPAELAKHCMEDIDAQFAGKVVEGDFIVADKNFGCGSSREHAPLAIKGCGVKAVIAPSFAAIFFRNAINIGLPLLELGAEAAHIGAGAVLAVDLAVGTVTDTGNGRVYQAQPLPGFIRDIAASGGLINYVREAQHG